ncbi:MAG: hypothetical protein QF486_00765 [Candidatus Woesearchaeota archaeon]|nr:hypothetical protein [Candidatus Woesearchaeota archaeon]MDP7181248.1 hypothetical protein [Candidatus Woesearchaeota archaeon]MDP7198133.1 hypothetical protein [Candidatus Woesearchaeota archaeon]MDP7466967.1 hypothetical protein [Candidatus Woesearchaeota archaeon]MDP7646947.1 hypothetical protein [Candidatus Woesearchaeota archaeon]
MSRTADFIHAAPPQELFNALSVIQKSTSGTMDWVGTQYEYAVMVKRTKIGDLTVAAYPQYEELLWRAIYPFDDLDQRLATSNIPLDRVRKKGVGAMTDFKACQALLEIYDGEYVIGHDSMLEDRRYQCLKMGIIPKVPILLLDHASRVGAYLEKKGIDTGTAHPDTQALYTPKIIRRCHEFNKRRNMECSGLPISPEEAREALPELLKKNELD